MQPSPSPITLKADLFLVHAPSVFDFRERDDVFFAYLSDSDSVNITSVFEMFPIGLLSIKQRLLEDHITAEIVNLASLMLMHPTLDVDALLRRMDAPVFGIDLHWMAHCHGAIEVAKRIKSIHPDALIIFGGISSTYFADELIQYPCVDVVVKGYDTLEPVAMLMKSVLHGTHALSQIPNLLYKDQNGEIQTTGFTYKPSTNYSDTPVDWSYYRGSKTDLVGSRLIMTLPNSGCAYDCPWCGGSRYAYQNMMGVQKTLITKDHSHIVKELRSLSDAAKLTTIYALQCYSETKERMHEYLDVVKEMQYRKVLFEQYHLTDDETLKKMGESTHAFVMLSPESHDQTISKLAGRGNYSMAEMEAWIPRALDAGIQGVFVWYFIGMPRQTRQSVLDTVAYSEHLLRKFRGKNVLPLICPMVPFLDPGSQLFEHPEKHGYRLFHRTLEEHRQAMVELRWHRRLNYETEWLSRREIQNVTYEAVGRLVKIKGDLGILPPSICEAILNTIDETQRMLHEIDTALAQDGQLPQSLQDEIRAYNRKILAYSSDQIIPLSRPFGGRWFDDFTVPSALIQELSGVRAPAIEI
ncbi:MAG: cobalamin B12-binding domain-containing protein [Anaerolineales bacterium]|nr:cobalamin B12-binding domain-containing protein [Anaerolineales bacterium]